MAIPMPASRDQPREVRAALRALPYLQETGWVESQISQSAVDANARPIPWYRYAAIDFLAERTDPQHRVFEFGSGNSTLWWAQRADTVTAVEHQPEWAARVRAAAPENVTLLEVPLEADRYCQTPGTTGSRYDVIVIDGRDRVSCALRCLDALSESGVVVWDDSQRRRYRPGLEFLRENGFRRLRFTGLGPIAPNKGETSVLYRSSNCFGI